MDKIREIEVTPAQLAVIGFAAGLSLGIYLGYWLGLFEGFATNFDLVMGSKSVLEPDQVTEEK